MIQRERLHPKHWIHGFLLSLPEVEHLDGEDAVTISHLGNPGSRVAMDHCYVDVGAKMGHAKAATLDGWLGPVTLRDGMIVDRSTDDLLLIGWPSTLPLNHPHVLCG